MSELILGPSSMLEAPSGPDSRRFNRRSVLHAIASGAAVTRADLARLTGLARPTVSSLVDELAEQGLVRELGTGPSAGGKRPILLGLDHEAQQIIAVDASVRPFAGVVADLSGDHLAAASAPEHLPPMDALLALVTELSARSTAPLAGIGVGTPGLVDGNGVVVEASNLGWHDLPLRELLEEAMGVPVWVANDADAAAVVEFGRLPEGRDGLALVRLGAGIGAGLVVGRRLHVGPRAAAGEIGHLVVDPDGRRCACGTRGCLETVATLPSIDAHAGLEGQTPPKDLDELRERAGAAAEAALSDAGRHLGTVLANLVAILDVSDLVLAVGRPGYGEVLATRVSDVIQASLLPQLADGVAVRTVADPGALVLDGAHALALAGALGIVRT